eukprot:scaffold118297_cov27-Tisochrysis_lutea.AAC.2
MDSACGKACRRAAAMVESRSCRARTCNSGMMTNSEGCRKASAAGAGSGKAPSCANTIRLSSQSIRTGTGTGVFSNAAAPPPVPLPEDPPPATPDTPRVALLLATVDCGCRHR